MADKQLRFVVTGVDKGASTTLEKVGTKGASVSSRLGSTFGKLGSTIGGEFGEVLDRVGQGFDKMGEHGHGALSKLAGTGALLAGTGALLTGLGDKEKAASQQLDLAIENTGHSAADFQGQIESTVHHMEKYGDTAVTTKNALQTLTQATHDPTKALSMMGEAADLAAAKHESLDTAATQLGKLLGGKGTKILAEYGIQVKTNADGTKNWSDANAQLAKVISGQANAASDTFTGKLKALKTEITDQVAVIGQKYGPALTAVGASMTIAKPLIEGVGAAVHGIGGFFKAFGETAVLADQEALASTGELAGGVQASAGAQGTAFAEVSTGAQAASGTAIAADSAAETSTAELASAVQTSATAQLGAFSEVASGAEASATAAVGADEAMIAGNRAVAASAETGTVSRLAVVGSFLKLAAAMAAVGVAGDFVGRKISAWEEKNNSLASNVDHLGGSLTNLNTALVNNGGQSDDVGKKWLEGALQANGLADKAAKAGITVDQMTGAIQEGTQATVALVDQWRASGKPSGDTITALLELSAGYQKTTTAAQDNAPATDSFMQAQKAAADAAQHAKDVLGKETEALKGLAQAQIGAMQSQDAFLSSLDSLTNGVKDNGKSLSINSEKGRANREAFLQAGQAAVSYANAQHANGVAIPVVTKQLEANVGQLIRTATNAGMSKSQVQQLVKQMGLTPKQISTLFNAITGQATSDLKSFVTKLRNVDGTTVRTFVEVTTVDKGASYGVSGGTHGSGGFKAYAAGGVMGFDERGTVGENGIEDFEKHGSFVKITPRAMSGVRSSGGWSNGSHGGITINVTASALDASAINGHDLGRQIAGALIQYAGMGGRLPIAHAIN